MAFIPLPQSYNSMAISLISIWIPYLLLLLLLLFIPAYYYYTQLVSVLAVNQPEQLAVDMIPSLLN